MSETVVVGAGPTGLAAALAMALQGCDVTVVEARSEPDERPKAIVAWSGALEVLARLGLEEDIRSLGLPLRHTEYRSSGRPLVRVAVDRVPGCAFPGPVSLPQPVVERLLRQRLADLGVSVRWGHPVTDVEQDADRARIRAGDLVLEASYVVGADGVGSVVRRAVGASMEGRAFEQEFLLADGEVSGAEPDTATYSLSPEGVVVVVPLAGGGHRVFLAAPAATAEVDDDPETVVRRVLAERAEPVRLGTVWWSSRFHVQTRVASTFRRGRLLLAGDAAHVHTPAGGQGMNTGIQDGYDVAWRLAATACGAAPALLEGYEAERRPAALRAVRQSDAQTSLWLARGRLRRALRDQVLRTAGRSPRLQAVALGRWPSSTCPSSRARLCSTRGCPGVPPSGAGPLPSTSAAVCATAWWRTLASTPPCPATSTSCR